MHQGGIDAEEGRALRGSEATMAPLSGMDESTESKPITVDVFTQLR